MAHYLVDAGDHRTRAWADRWPRTSLSGWSDANYVDHPASAATDDQPQGTLAMWLFTTAATTRQQVWTKSPTSGTAPTHIEFRLDLVPARINFRHLRATVNLLIDAESGLFPAFGANKWIFVAAQWSTTVDALCKLYVGDEQRPPSEPSAYVTQTAGSGALTTDATTPHRVGNHPISLGRPFIGSIEGICITSVCLGARVRDLWARGPSGVDVPWLLVSRYGANGAVSPQPDLSGCKLDGTVAGTLVRDLGRLYPLPQTTRRRWLNKTAATAKPWHYYAQMRAS